LEKNPAKLRIIFARSEPPSPFVNGQLREVSALTQINGDATIQGAIICNVSIAQGLVRSRAGGARCGDACLLGPSSAKVARHCDQQRDSIGSLNRDLPIDAMSIPRFGDDPNLTFEPGSMSPIAMQTLPGISIEGQTSSLGSNLARQPWFSKCNVAGEPARLA
jgi:hypothetical protein